MTRFLNEWKNLTYAAMSGQVPTIIEAFEGAVDRAEARAAGKVLDFGEAADFYHGDNPEYIARKLRRVMQYLYHELNEAEFQRCYRGASREREDAVASARRIIEGILFQNFNGEGL